VKIPPKITKKKNTDSKREGTNQALKFSIPEDTRRFGPPFSIKS
jgi:hypothetical protein